MAKQLLLGTALTSTMRRFVPDALPMSWLIYEYASDSWTHHQGRFVVRSHG